MHLSRNDVQMPNVVVMAGQEFSVEANELVRVQCTAYNHKDHADATTNPNTFLAAKDFSPPHPDHGGPTVKFVREDVAEKVTTGVKPSP